MLFFRRDNCVDPALKTALIQKYQLWPALTGSDRLTSDRLASGRLNGSDIDWLGVEVRWSRGTSSDRLTTWANSNTDRLNIELHDIVCVVCVIYVAWPAKNRQKNASGFSLVGASDRQCFYLWDLRTDQTKNRSRVLILKWLIGKMCSKVDAHHQILDVGALISVWSWIIGIWSQDNAVKAVNIYHIMHPKNTSSEHHCRPTRS